MYRRGSCRSSSAPSDRSCCFGRSSSQSGMLRRCGLQNVLPDLHLPQLVLSLSLLASAAERLLSSLLLFRKDLNSRFPSFFYFDILTGYSPCPRLNTLEL